ncbi:MAG: hypothetical protein II771_08540 [Clostridia bacterium]|nr:hypothetical protein [Clostridia bacterium]
MENKAFSGRGGRAALLLPLLLLLSLLLSACAKGPAAEEIAPRVRELCERSFVLNEIYYGAGLPAVASATGSDYFYIDIDQTDFYTADLIREETEAVYTADYAARIEEAAFTGVTSEVGALLARFSEDGDGNLMQHRDAESILPGKRAFLYDTLTVERSSPSEVKVRLAATLDGEKDDDALLTLKKENGVWLLDTPTY